MSWRVCDKSHSMVCESTVQSKTLVIPHLEQAQDPIITSMCMSYEPKIFYENWKKRWKIAFFSSNTKIEKCAYKSLFFCFGQNTK